MHVLHVISGIDPRSGGPASALIGLTQALTAQGTHITVATMWHADNDLSAAERMRGQGIQVKLIGPGRGPLAWHPKMAATLKELIAKVDVVHIHTLWEELQHQAAKIAYRLGVPYIIRPCGMLDPWSLAQNPLKKRLYLAWRLRKNLNRAAAIHYTSNTERDLTTPLGLTPPTIVEPNGVDIDEFHNLPSAGTFRSHYPQIGDRPVVLFMSRIHPKKGLDLLIPAFAQGAPAHAMLVIAGPGHEDYLQKVHEMVRRAGIENRTVFTGMLHGQDRLAVLADADLFVLPSYQENFGIVVIEALAIGTPVITSDQVNIHAEITAAGIGGVVPMDTGALARELKRWLDDPSLRQQASTAGPSFVEKHYDWNPIAQRWNRHYTRLIESLCTEPTTP